MDDNASPRVSRARCRQDPPDQSGILRRSAADGVPGKGAEVLAALPQDVPALLLHPSAPDADLPSRRPVQRPDVSGLREPGVRPVGHFAFRRLPHAAPLRGAASGQGDRGRLRPDQAADQRSIPDAARTAEDRKEIRHGARHHGLLRSEHSVPRLRQPGGGDGAGSPPHLHLEEPGRTRVRALAMGSETFRWTAAGPAVAALSGLRRDRAPGSSSRCALTEPV